MNDLDRIVSEKLGIEGSRHPQTVLDVGLCFVGVERLEMTTCDDALAKLFHVWGVQSLEYVLLAEKNDLQERLTEAYRERFTLRRELALGRLEDHNRITAVKRDIARVRTVLRERELSAHLVREGVEAQ